MDKIFTLVASHPISAETHLPDLNINSYGVLLCFTFSMGETFSENERKKHNFGFERNAILSHLQNHSHSVHPLHVPATMNF